MVKNLPEMQETGFDPWVRKIPGEGNGNPLQYSCLGNPRTEESGGLPPMGVSRVDTINNNIAAAQTLFKRQRHGQREAKNTNFQL